MRKITKDDITTQQWHRCSKKRVGVKKFRCSAVHFFCRVSSFFFGQRCDKINVSDSSERLQPTVLALQGIIVLIDGHICHGKINKLRPLHNRLPLCYWSAVKRHFVCPTCVWAMRKRRTEGIISSHFLVHRVCSRIDFFSPQFTSQSTQCTERPRQEKFEESVTAVH